MCRCNISENFCKIFTTSATKTRWRLESSACCHDNSNRNKFLDPVLFFMINGSRSDFNFGTRRDDNIYRLLAVFDSEGKDC